MIRYDRHWEIIKLITKQSIKLNQSTYIIKQNMINAIKKHPNEIKEILKKTKQAENNWKMALDQFNNSITDHEIDESILKLIECEKNVELAMNFANTTLKELLWSENKN